MNEEKMLEAIARVRVLHKPIQVNFIFGDVCSICCDHTNDYEEWVKFPCPTIKALDGEQ